MTRMKTHQRLSVASHPNTRGQPKKRGLEEWELSAASSSVFCSADATIQLVLKV